MLSIRQASSLSSDARSRGRVLNIREATSLSGDAKTPKKTCGEFPTRFFVFLGPTVPLRRREGRDHSIHMVITI